MIFITLGSQKFQFNRLLKKIDELVENKKIEKEIFAQIGYSDYKPKNFKYKEFIDRDEFKEFMEKSEIVIAHGGTGAIITAVKQGKKVIAIPRLAKYEEHVDDHQMQIVTEFEASGIIKAVYDMDNLEKSLKEIKTMQFEQYVSNTQNIIDDIENFIIDMEKFNAENFKK